MIYLVVLMNQATPYHYNKFSLQSKNYRDILNHPRTGPSSVQVFDALELLRVVSAYHTYYSIIFCTRLHVMT